MHSAVRRKTLADEDGTAPLRAGPEPAAGASKMNPQPGPMLAVFGRAEKPRRRRSGAASLIEAERRRKLANAAGIG
jgi:hypothetical protein